MMEKNIRRIDGDDKICKKYKIVRKNDAVYLKLNLGQFALIKKKIDKNRNDKSITLRYLETRQQEYTYNNPEAAKELMELS